MGPVTEIALLPLKPSTNPTNVNSPEASIWTSTLSTVLSQPGCQRAYWGLVVEDPSMLRLFVDWDSLDAHKAFMASPPYKPFVSHLRTILSSSDEPTLYHATLTPHPPSAALSSTTSPVTELLTIYFPSNYSPSDQSTFVSGFQSLISALSSHAPADSGYTASAGGWILEEDLTSPKTGEKATVYSAAIGWQSLQHHLRFRETQAFSDNVHHLRGAKDLLEIVVVHASLTETRPGLGHGEAAGEDALQAAQEEGG